MIGACLILMIRIQFNICAFKCFPPDGHQRELSDNVRHHLQSSPQTAARHSHQDRLEQDPQLQDRQRDAKRLEAELVPLPSVQVRSRHSKHHMPFAQHEVSQKKKKKVKNFFCLKEDVIPFNLLSLIGLDGSQVWMRFK